MLVIIISAFFCTTLTQALSPNTGPDYLDPILYQEHAQSPNGRYKYGYESNKASAHEERDSVGTIKGFYSYLDDQGKVQHVEYLAGHDGFKIVGDHGVPGYTPEVEAARKAHLDVYLETKRRDLAQYREALENKPVKKSEEYKDKPLTINIPLVHESKPINNPFLAHSSFGNKDINLFSGKPLHSSYQDNTHNIHSSVLASWPTTTPRPQDYTSKNVENNFFILPTPTVHHYEKIWPLPPLRFKDLEVRVNGQDLYDPRPRYPFDNTVSASSMASKNSFDFQQKTIPFINPNNIPFVNQFIQHMNTGSNTDHLSKPPFPSLTDQVPQITEKPQNIFQTIQSGLQSFNENNPFLNTLGQIFRPIGTDSNTPTQITERPQNNIFNTPQMIFQAIEFPNNPFLNQMSQNIPLINREADSRTSYVQPFKTSELTAHQADLLNYREQQSAKYIMPSNVGNINEEYVNSVVSIAPRNNVEAFDDTRNGLLSNAEKNIAALAAKKAFHLLRGTQE